MGSEAGLVMSPFAWRAAMADVLDRDRTQRDEPSPQRRIDASFAGVDPMRGQGLPTETGAVPLAIMANTRLGQGGGFPAPQGAPGAAAMGPPMPRPAPSPQPGAPMNILPEYAQRFAAFAGAGPLTFLERDSYLQRDPETGAYLSQPRARRDGRAAHAERLMDEDERRQLLARELMTPRLPTDPDRQVWPEYRPITDDGPRPTWPLVAAPMMSQAAARELYDAVGVPPLSAGETALDVAKSTGIGLAKVPIHALGMPGDVGSFASTATDWAARKLGASPETIDRIKRSGRRAFGLNPMFAPFVNAPTSAEIQGGVETVTGKFYEPQTAIGEKAEALAGFAGGAVMPGGIARRVVGGVVAPFVGSEGLAAIPGIQGTALEAPARMVGGVLGGGAGSARAVRTAPQSRQQNSAYIYDAPPKPQRPFAEDYPQGARADAAGKLLEDMDGRPLTAKYVAGRRTLNGPDEALTPAEINEIAKANTGKYPRLVPEKVIGKDTAGLMKFDPHTGKPKQILVHKDLPSAEVPRVTAHEVSHTIDQIAGEIPTQGITRQFRRNYNTLNNPNRTPDGLDVAPGAQPVTPVKFGYKPHQFREEYVVEALRAYLTNPNYIKTVAPKTAERLREYVNTHPQLSKIIQLNTVLGPTAAALLARELMREPPDDL